MPCIALFLTVLAVVMEPARSLGLRAGSLPGHGAKARRMAKWKVPDEPQGAQDQAWREATLEPVDGGAERPAAVPVASTNVSLSDFKGIITSMYSDLGGFEAQSSQSSMAEKREVLRQMLAGGSNSGADAASLTGKPVLDMIIILVGFIQDLNVKHEGIVAKVQEETVRCEKGKEKLQESFTKKVADDKARHEEELKTKENEYRHEVENLQEAFNATLKAAESQCESQKSELAKDHAKALIKKDEERLAAEKAAELVAAAEQETAVAEESDRCKTQVANLEKLHESDLSTKQAEYDGQLAELKEKHQEELKKRLEKRLSNEEKLKAEKEAAVDAEVAKCGTENAALRTEHGKKVTAMAAANLKKEQELDDKHETAVAQVKKACAEAKEKLREEVETTKTDMEARKETAVTAAKAAAKADCNKEQANLASQHLHAETALNLKLEECHTAHDAKAAEIQRLMEEPENLYDWHFMANDKDMEIAGRDSSPLKDEMKRGVTLADAEAKCAKHNDCTNFCWNPDDVTSYYTSSNQGFRRVGNVGQGWKCFTKKQKGAYKFHYMNNDAEQRYIGMDDPDLTRVDLKEWGESHEAAEGKCAGDPQCNFFCHNPDDFSVYYTKRTQGFQQVGRHGRGWKCYSKVWDGETRPEPLSRAKKRHVRTVTNHYWDNQCTLCPSSWYNHCSGGGQRVGERGCGWWNLGCEGYCRNSWQEVYYA